MAKIDITRTELVWPGKYNEDGMLKEVPRVSLPFQVIETINESRATREADKQRQQTLFDIWEGKENDGEGLRRASCCYARVTDVGGEGSAFYVWYD